MRSPYYAYKRCEPLPIQTACDCNLWIRDMTEEEPRSLGEDSRRLKLIRARLRQMDQEPERCLDATQQLNSAAVDCVPGWHLPG